MNKEKFTYIYNTIYPLLFRYVYRLCKNEESSKDICQEAFLKFYTETSNGKIMEHEKSWIFKCATNDFLNKIKRKQIIVFESLSSINESYETQNPENKYIKTENLKNIELAISNLNDTEKKLIYLYQEEFSYAEISDITGIKSTSVGKTLSRTIEKISTQLQKTMSYEML